MKHWLPFLNNTEPHLNPTDKILFNDEHWIQIYSNQKEMNYISLS